MTKALRDFAQGDASAADRVLDKLYGTLRQVARGLLAGDRSRLLEPTDLTHRAFLKAIAESSHAWGDRQHFVRTVVRVMRRAITDEARVGRAAKRGGGWQRVELDDPGFDGEVGPMVALDEILAGLERVHPEVAATVEMRVFAGMNQPEVAAALAVSRRQADRYWRFGRAWLRRAMTGES